MKVFKAPHYDNPERAFVYIIVDNILSINESRPGAGAWIFLKGGGKEGYHCSLSAAEIFKKIGAEII